MAANLRKEMKKSYVHHLSALSVLSLTLGIYINAHLEPEDRIKIDRGLCLFFLGFVFFTSLYYFINDFVLKTVFGSKIVKKFKLTQADVYDTSNKIVSAVQAVLSCVSGAMVCLYSCPRNLLKTSHYISEAYAWFGASYFFYDIWSMYKVHCAQTTSVVTPSSASSSQVVNGESKLKSVCNNNNNNNGAGFWNNFKNFFKYVRYNPLIVGHHLFIGGFGFLVITYLRGGLGDCVFGFVYFMEFSTPFVSFRGILSRFGMKASKLYVVNGFMMLVTFFICRIVMFPYVIYLYANFIGKDILTAISTLPRGCKISIMILVFPQLYWFGLMLKGAKQVLKPKPPPSASSAANIAKKKRSATNFHS